MFNSKYRPMPYHFLSFAKVRDQLIITSIKVKQQTDESEHRPFNKLTVN